MKSNWIYGLLVFALLFSCNSPKRQKKINDGRLFEKLKEQQGYLNAEELQRLERDFSLKLLDKYDLSGYDEEDTLASFLRVGKDVWIASCYLENPAETHYPFFRLTETKEKGFNMMSNGLIPIANGACAYELNKLLVRSGEYIFLSRIITEGRNCIHSPVVFRLNGKMVDRGVDFAVAVWTDSREENTPVQSEFTIESKTPDEIVFHVHEKVIDTEMDEEIRARNYDLNFEVKNNTIYFQDTIFR